MTTPPTKPYTTKSGRVLSDYDIDTLADEVAGDIDVETLKPRRRGRPPLAGGPADVVPVRLDANLRAAVEERAANDHTTTSDVIREALRRYLDAT
jgi:Ribbon-helix-helix protein, copG family